MQIFLWIMQPLKFLETCAQRHGDCFEAGKLQALCVFSHPIGVFTAGDQFDSGRGNGILQRTLGDALLLDGERHKHQRQLLMPPFHGERMRAYGELICQITEQVTSQWQATQSFAVRPFMQEILPRDFASRVWL